MTTNNTLTQAKKNIPINQCTIGKTTCLSEIITVKLKDGSLFRAQLHYNDRAMHSLVSDQVGPICLGKSSSQYPIELSTVCGSTTSIRQIATVKLSDSISLEGIVVKGLHVENQSMSIPRQWSNIFLSGVHNYLTVVSYQSKF